MYLKVIAQYQENNGYHDGKDDWVNKEIYELKYIPRDWDYFEEYVGLDKWIAERDLKSMSNKECRHLLIKCERVYESINQLSNS